MLANIVRTDATAHRPLPADTDSALAIRVLARAQQDAVWSRQRFGNEVRSLLKEYFPAALTAFQSLEDGLTRPDARSVLAAAPTPPTAAAALTRPPNFGRRSRERDAPDSSTETSNDCGGASCAPRRFASHRRSKQRWESV